MENNKCNHGGLNGSGLGCSDRSAAKAMEYESQKDEKISSIENDQHAPDAQIWHDNVKTVGSEPVRRWTSGGSSGQNIPREMYEGENALTEVPQHDRPAEEQVRQHFGKLLKDTDAIMRPPYTTIWALEDGTLLWDWKSGYADLGPVLKNIILLIQPTHSSQAKFMALFDNAVNMDLRGFGAERILKELHENVGVAKTIVLSVYRAEWNTIEGRFIEFRRQFNLYTPHIKID